MIAPFSLGSRTRIKCPGAGGGQFGISLLLKRSFRVGKRSAQRVVSWCGELKQFSGNDVVSHINKRPLNPLSKIERTQHIVSVFESACRAILSFERILIFLESRIIPVRFPLRLLSSRRSISLYQV